MSKEKTEKLHYINFRISEDDYQFCNKLSSMDFNSLTIELREQFSLMLDKIRQGKDF